MKYAAIAIMVGSLGICGPVLANQKLVEEKQCLQCHAVAQDTIGPSFKSIRGRWQGKPDAEKQLVATIRRGSAATGGPHWGKAKMPDDKERPLVSEAEAKTIVKWIMAQ